jgi:hypothetical protein
MIEHMLSMYKALSSITSTKKSPEINPPIYSPMIFNKDTKTIKGGKDTHFLHGVGKTRFIEKSNLGFLPCVMYKFQNGSKT